MKRLLSLMALTCAVVFMAATPVQPQTLTTSATSNVAFPLTTNILFPARAQRIGIKCYNDTVNAVATVSYEGVAGTGFTFKIQPGGSLWDFAATNLTGRVPDGIIYATGTAANVLSCVDYYVR